MPAGKHARKIRQYTRRIDRLLAEERERRKPLPPPPPPISAEHAALRRKIAETCRTLLYDPENPEGTDQMRSLEERMHEDPELAIVAAELIALQREEQGLLAKNGVVYRPYDFSQLE